MPAPDVSPTGTSIALAVFGMTNGTISAIAIVTLISTSCGGRTVVVTPAEPVSASQMAELWADPGDAPRDTYWGIGGKPYAPPKDATYTFVAKDESGFSVSFDVKSPDDVEWSAKIGPEAQTEVVLSRI